jgi:transposase InsO family protein
VSDAVVVDALLATRGTPEGLYGRRTRTAHLRRVGRRRHEPVLERVSHHTIDRLMRDLGLFGVLRGRKLRTTIPDPAAPARSPNLLERDFTAPAPNQRWVADFTTSGPGPASCSSRSSSTSTPNGSSGGTPRRHAPQSWS